MDINSRLNEHALRLITNTVVDVIGEINNSKDDILYKPDNIEGLELFNNAIKSISLTVIREKVGV